MLVHSSAGGHEGYFHLLAIAINAAMSLLIHVLTLGCSYTADVSYYLVRFPLLLVPVGFPFLDISSVFMGLTPGMTLNVLQVSCLTWPTPPRNIREPTKSFSVSVRSPHAQNSTSVALKGLRPFKNTEPQGSLLATHQQSVPRPCCFRRG